MSLFYRYLACLRVSAALPNGINRVFILESLGIGPAITRVSDGDTVQLLDSDGVRHKVRLAKIDAPESKQEWGREAAEMLRGLVGDKMVRENRLGLWASSNVISPQEWRSRRKHYEFEAERVDE